MEVVEQGRGIKSYHHGNLKQALLDSSILILSENGIDQLTLREAARRAGVSQAAPYRHFENKDALIAELVQEGFARISRRIVSSIEDQNITEPEMKLRVMGQAYFDFAMESPDYFQLLSSTGVDKVMAYLKSDAQNNELVQIGLKIIDEVKSVGKFNTHTKEEVFVTFWSICFGFASIYITGRNNLLHVSQERLQSLFTDAFGCLLEK